MPGMASAPIASTRACSTASKTARAGCPRGGMPGVHAVVVVGEAQRHAIGGRG